MINLAVSNDTSVWASYSSGISLNKNEPGTFNLQAKDLVIASQEGLVKNADKAKPEPAALQMTQTALQSPEPNRGIRFDLNPDTKSIVVKVIDTNTEKVLMQIPSIEAINAAISSDNLKGFFIDIKA